MTESTQTSDDDLLQRSTAGDEEAFIALFHRRQAAVFRFALNMSGSETIAEEVVQEVFLTLIRDGARFDSTRGSASAYLFGIARNHVLRVLERDRPYVAVDGTDAPDGRLSPLADVTRTEAINAVRQAVLSLPPTYREAVVMCDLEEMSYADAASALDIPVGTVRSRLSRGRALLLEKMTAGRCLA